MAYIKNGNEYYFNDVFITPGIWILNTRLYQSGGANSPSNAAAFYIAIDDHHIGGEWKPSFGIYADFNITSIAKVDTDSKINVYSNSAIKFYNFTCTLKTYKLADLAPVK